MTEVLRQEWERLAVHGQRLGESELNYVSLSSSYKGHPLLLAIDANKFRHLLVPIASGATVIGDKQSRGIRIEARQLEEDGGVRSFIDVVCLIPDLNDLFDDVLNDMIRVVSDDPGNPSAECRKVLDRWREFIERGRLPKLGREALVGLFGELVTLRDLVRMDLTSLDTWWGSRKSRQDFLSDSLALEVKTSTRRNGRSGTINGHLQLLPPPGGELKLLYFKVEEAPGGQSIPEIVEEILGAGVDRLEFRNRLQAADYDDSYANEYADFRLSILERRMYAVDETFPRIVPDSFVEGDLPSGVEQLVYTIDLVGELPKRLDKADEEAFLARLATGGS